jgi:hypothetical protein
VFCSIFLSGRATKIIYAYAFAALLDKISSAISIAPRIFAEKIIISCLPEAIFSK